MLSAAVVCRVRWPNQRELSRKIVHIGTGPVIPLAWWLGIPSDWAIPMAILITIVILINHRWRLLPAIEDVNRHSYGTVAYALTITLLLIFFWPENAAAVCSGVLVMAFGDGLAGLIGRKVRSPNWLIWGQRKSIAGTLTMAVITLIILFSGVSPQYSSSVADIRFALRFLISRSSHSCKKLSRATLLKEYI